MKAILTAAVASVVLGASYVALAQQGTHEQHQGAATTQAQKGPKMEMCKAMMAEQEMHAAHMKTMDAKLDALVGKMDKATGMAKMNATSDVIKELVGQRKSMHSMMQGMNTKMMAHMMEHMQAGNMGDCPMMKKMKDGGGQHSNP